MDTNLILTVLLILNIALLILQFVLFLHIREERLVMKEEEHELTSGDVAMLNDAKAKSASLLHRAIKQANNILVSSELKGIGLFSEYKLEGKRVQNDYQRHLSQFEQKMQTEFEKSLKRGEETYGKMIDSVTATLKQHVADNQKILEEKSNTFIVNAQKELDTFVTDIQTGVKDQVNRELTVARAAVDEYKQRRLSAVEENIIEILEKTLVIALSKKLSLSDQAELVFLALEEAKRERLFK